MKKLTLLAIAFVLLLPSCMDRPDNLDNTEPETEAETEYTPPPKSYIDQLRDNLGYFDGPDSIFCYVKPLVEQSAYITPEEMKYDMNREEETRFLSCNHTYSYEVAYINMDGEDDLFARSDAPNIVYLTEADGTRTKLCPYEECRDDFYETCHHLVFPLSSALVYEDYVYFLGRNLNAAAPNNPLREKHDLPELARVHMLLRYSLKEHRIEKVLDLPGESWIHSAGYGLIYLTTYDSVSNMWYNIIYSPDDNTAAKAPYINAFYDCLFSDGIYIPQDDGTYRVYEPNLASYKEAERNPHLTHRTERYRLDGGDGPIEWTYFTKMDNQAYRMYHIDSRGRESLMLERIVAYQTGKDALYVIEYADARVVHAYTEESWLYDYYGTVYVNTDTSVYRYDMKSNGRIDPDSKTAVFTEGIDTIDTDEKLFAIQPYGDYVRVATLHPPMEGTDDRCVWRKYIIKDGTVTFDGEGVTTGNSVD